MKALDKKLLRFQMTTYGIKHVYLTDTFIIKAILTLLGNGYYMHQLSIYKGPGPSIYLQIHSALLH